MFLFFCPAMTLTDSVPYMYNANLKYENSDITKPYNLGLGASPPQAKIFTIWDRQNMIFLAKTVFLKRFPN